MRNSALASLLLLIACNDANPSDAAASCVPGEQVACACPGGGPPGVQVCEDSGERFGACVGCGLLAGSTGPADDPGGSSSADPSGDPTTTTTGTSGPVPGTSTGPDEPLPGEPSGPPQAVPPAPPPDGWPVVEQVAIERPDLLAASCVDTGGNNEFLYEVVRRLRQQDDRWGLNWKRGVVGDLSQDVVDYHYGDGVSEESTDVYIIDIIVGHCGDNPQAGWIDVTQATLDANTVGMWTLAGQDL
jgi:hypothetical protein